MKPLQGKVAIVAGATRGAGRGIATMLGEAGATVYVTGRSTKGNPSSIGRTETIEETAALVTSYGGSGIPVRVDHLIEEEVKALFQRIDEEQKGRLDLLVNSLWGGESLTEWGVPFWEHSLAKGLQMQRQAVQAHLITSHYGVPLMVKRKSGLMIEVTDGVDYRYRGSLFYSLAKISGIHLAKGMAKDLTPYHVTAVSVTPGFLRSEEMLDHFGVAEENWRDATKQDPHFIASETPFFVGRAIAALTGDPNVNSKTGQALSSWELGREYGFRDQDGSRPDWGKYYEEHVE